MFVVVLLVEVYIAGLRNWLLDNSQTSRLLVDACWLCCTAVERRSVNGELSLSLARPAADG